MTGRRAALVVTVVAILVVGCGEDQPPGPTDPPSSTAIPTPEPSATATAPDEDPLAGVDLAPVPPATVGWATSIGLPVVGAVRTSTPLARLAGTPVDERLEICSQVAAELDAIASPQVLSGLAVTADAETATLLVGDLRAKADLLGVCDRDGPEVEALVAEVARTHAVAAAWLQAVGSAS